MPTDPLDPLAAQLLEELRARTAAADRQHGELVGELRRVGDVMERHEVKSAERHAEQLATLKIRDAGAEVATKALVENQRAWGRRVERAAAWVGPKAWEALRTPLGLILLVVVLSRVLGVAPTTILSWLGASAPAQVETAPDSRSTAPPLDDEDLGRVLDRPEVVAAPVAAGDVASPSPP